MLPDMCVILALKATVLIIALLLLIIINSVIFNRIVINCLLFVISVIVDTSMPTITGSFYVPMLIIA